MQTGGRFAKDHYAALLLMVIGIVVIAAARAYRVGTLTHMGAGFMPFVLGVLILIVGLLIGVTAAPSPDTAAPFRLAEKWRGWAAILGAVVTFMVLGRYGGLVPATIVSVFVAALGDRKTTWREAMALAVVMAIVGVVIFDMALKIPLPAFAWG